MQTVEEYIAAQPDSVQPYLRQVRDAIRAALPDVQEGIEWKMPTYWHEHNIIHFAQLLQGFSTVLGMRNLRY